MEKLDSYRDCIKQIISDYAKFGTIEGVERQLTFDTERDHYHLINVGWPNGRRVHGCVIHIDLKDDKIWIQYNGTEVDLAQELVALGIPKQDIVLGLHASHKRQFTGYAVG